MLNLGYCPIGNGDKVAPFNKVFANKQDISEKGFVGVDAVVFWGGTDISPTLYQQGFHPYSQATRAGLSTRDEFEWRAMKYCKVNNIPMIGVCRGAQMLCAFAGGYLIQHATGHHSNHKMTTSDGVEMETTSCHHQMMYPFNIPHEMLAWTSNKRSIMYEGEEGEDLSDRMVGRVEPEVVYFPTVRGLAIQGHPEWSIGTEFSAYCNGLIESHLLGAHLEN